MEEVNIQDELKLRLTPIASNYLLTASRWAKFISILGFILSGLILIMAFSMSTIMSLTMAGGGGVGLAGFPFFLVGILYGVVAAVYFFLSYSVYNFGSKTHKGIKMHNEYDIESGTKSLKNTFLIIGIMAIIGLSMMVLTIFIGIIAGVASVF